MNEKKQCQADKILRYLIFGNTLTSWEALGMFGCMRLGARIYELKRQGHAIKKEMTRTARGTRGKWVAKYSLEQKTETK